MQSNLNEYADYIRHLRNHDWYFDWSDDFSVWVAGNSSYRNLVAKQRLLDPIWLLWNEYAPEDMRRYPNEM